MREEEERKGEETSKERRGDRIEEESRDRRQ